MTQNRFRSAAAAAVTTLAFALAAGSAHAQGTTIQASSPFSGSFGVSHIDTNGDGLDAGTEHFGLLSGPLGPSSIEGLDEFVFVAEGTCANGNPGVLYALLIAPTTPAALVQRFEQSGDLLSLIETSGSACLDTATGMAFLESRGNIVGGTGRLAGATGTFVQRSTAVTLFVNSADAFGPQTGTFDETIVLPN